MQTDPNKRTEELHLTDVPLGSKHLGDVFLRYVEIMHWLFVCASLCFTVQSAKLQ